MFGCSPWGETLHRAEASVFVEGASVGLDDPFDDPQSEAAPMIECRDLFATGDNLLFSRGDSRSVVDHFEFDGRRIEFPGGDGCLRLG